MLCSCNIKYIAYVPHEGAAQEQVIDAVPAEEVSTDAQPEASEEEIDPDIPVVITETDVETPTVLEGEEVEVSYDEVAPEEEPAPKKSSNTPYFIGAALAVALLIGVSFYCRVKDNK